MIVLPSEVIELLGSSDATVLLATVDESGSPHVVPKSSFAALPDGMLAYAEYIESSQSNSNVVRALWYGGVVAILIVGRDGRAFQVKGHPVRFDYTGPLYERYYARLHDLRPTPADLAGVWLIEPDEISDQNLSSRQGVEDMAHPFFRHIDRLVHPGQHALARGVGDSECKA